MTRTSKREIGLILLINIIILGLMVSCRANGQQITNLPVTVTVTTVTNTVATDNGNSEIIQVACSNKTPGYGCAAIHYGPGPNNRPATEKTETTTVKEITVLVFDFKGQRRMVDEKIISRVVKKFELDSKWKLVNEDAAEKGNYLFATNGIFLNGVIGTNTSVRQYERYISR